MRDVDRGILHVGQDQCELYTGIPVLWWFALPCMLEVERGMLRMVSVGEEENAPILASEIHPFCFAFGCSSVPGENCYPPRRAATLEDRAVRLFIHFPPVLDMP